MYFSNVIKALRFANENYSDYTVRFCEQNKMFYVVGKRK